MSLLLTAAALLVARIKRRPRRELAIDGLLDARGSLLKIIFARLAVVTRERMDIACSVFLSGMGLATTPGLPSGKRAILRLRVWTRVVATAMQFLK